MTNGIPKQEFQERLQRIRGLMKKRDLDVLFIFSLRRSQVAYVSGYRPNYYTNCAVVVLPLERDPILWIRFAFDLSRAKATSWFEDIRVSPSYEMGPMIAECTKAIQSLGLERSRIGLVSADIGVDEMGLSTYEIIRSQLPGAQFESASNLFNELRLKKSQYEIEYLRAAAQLGDAIADSFRRAVKPGEKEYLATAAAEYTARREGAECAIWISSDCSRMALPASDFEFRQGSVVNCEFTVQFQGYWTQICRVFFLGKPSAEQREIFAVCRKAYQAVVSTARPGNTVSSLAEAAYKAIAEGGYKDYMNYATGHGVGLENTEPYLMDQECKAQLSSNMAFIAHPALWVPQRGAAWVGGPFVVSQDGNVVLDKPQSEIFEI